MDQPEPYDFARRLGERRRSGWELVEVDTSETVVHDDGPQTVLMTSYLLRRAAAR